jgi:hypothetical protein
VLIIDVADPPIFANKHDRIQVIENVDSCILLYIPLGYYNRVGEKTVNILTEILI